MISFDLRCGQSHVFEVWFGSSQDYEDQRKNGHIECPFCGDANSIEKAPMAPNVASRKDAVRQEQPPEPTEPTPRGTGSETASDISPNTGPAQAPTVPTQQQVMQLAMRLREYVEKNSEDVGQSFPEEARKIHYGETEERAIHGQATEDEREELADEGIEVTQIPWVDPIKH